MANARQFLASRNSWSSVSSEDHPYDFEVEWLESHGTEYIDLGFVPNSSTKIIIESYNIGGGTVSPCGVRDAASSYYCFVYWNIGNTIRFDIGRPGTQENIFQRDTVGNWFKAEYKNNNAKFDNVSKHITSHDLFPSYTLNLFSNKNGMTPANFFIGRIKSFEAYENDVLKMRLKPVVKSLEGCMYDEVSKTLLRNKGGGAFGF